jgi:hypothetical protein
MGERRSFCERIVPEGSGLPTPLLVPGPLEGLLLGGEAKPVFSFLHRRPPSSLLSLVAGPAVTVGLVLATSTLWGIARERVTLIEGDHRTTYRT